MAGRSAKRLAMLLLLAGAGLGMLAWTQPWAQLRLGDGAELVGAGADASPGTMALAAAALAAVAALAIAGPFFRMVMGALMIVVGGLSTWLALGVDAFRALGAAVRQHTALADDAAVRAVIDGGEGGLTAWPIVAAVGGALIAATGLFVLATGRGWPETGRRYSTTRLADAERGGVVDTGDRVDQWDALSAGDDPTTAAGEDVPEARPRASEADDDRAGA